LTGTKNSSIFPSSKTLPTRRGFLFWAIVRGRLCRGSVVDHFWVDLADGPGNPPNTEALIMAIASHRPCRYAGCRSYAVRHGYCDQHQDKHTVPDRARGTATERGYDSRWRAARDAHLESEPLCRHCCTMGLIVAATVVDHIQPHKGDKALFWRRSNWQSLCQTCHNRKTASEDRGAWSPKRFN